MNRLKDETSPYLLQHAHNPVDWYAWAPEAFERARREDKPILVSIGYSTCHWCHVMERESFEVESTAAYMNEHFINIKVDREERPDVDQIYMEACQAFSGQGGWPLNCFLLPDGRPFYAGTYYPPKPAHSRPAWLQLLARIVDAFQNRRDLVDKQAEQLTGMISRSDAVLLREDLIGLSGEERSRFTRELQANMFSKLQSQFDKVYGGFGGAPKFPGAMTLEYLLAYDHFYQEPEALHQVELSLDRMIGGGIYDQLGGGFARYATDRAWLVPHFEKMLYDNALLVETLATAYQRTGHDDYREAIEETLDFIGREMTSPEGGFYSALDADSEGVEGKFYVWDHAEIMELAGDDAPLFIARYGVREEGNWEETNILWRARSLADLAAESGADEQALRRRLNAVRQKLFERRSGRVRPGLDDKIILGWNALQVSAFARAFEALGNDAYRQAAVRSLNFLLDRLRQADGQGFFHTYKDGNARYDAFLDDYAFLIDALLDVYEITFEERLLHEAMEWTEYLLEHFLDLDTGLFFYTSAKQTDIIMRKRELYDSATPSGNSTMAHNLLRLAALLDRADLRERAVQLLGPMLESFEKYPSSFSRWASASLFLTAPAFEIAVVGENAESLAIQLQQHYLPNKVLMAASDGDDRYPLLAGKPGGVPARIYVCRQYACQTPVTSVEEAIKMVSL